MTDRAALVARYRDRVRRQVLEHGSSGSDPRAAVAARTRDLLRLELSLSPAEIDRLVEASAEYLVAQLHALAKERGTGLNEVTAELLKQGLKAK